MSRPDVSEFHEYYARYVDRVPDGDIADILEAQIADSLALLAAVPVERETYAYAAGKWTVRDVVGHVADVERVFASRCLWVARGVPVDQPGMEQDEWARRSNASSRPLADLVREWAAVRADTVQLCRGLDEEAWARAGMASGSRFSARSFPWIIAGHELHHRAVLRERYLGNGA